MAKKNNKILWIIGIVIVLVVAGFVYLNNRNGGGDSSIYVLQQEGCVNSGGTVETGSACLSSGSFPNTCLIGAMVCSPSNSHKVKFCNCGQDKCFDGYKCVEVSVN